MTFGIHVRFLALLFLFAFLVNSAPLILTGIPLSFQLSSDAELHVAHWRDLSSKESGIFETDAMFQKDTRPAGELLIDQKLVRMGEFFGWDVIDWSIAVSAVALLVFLSGVYAVVAYTLQDAFLGFVVALGSVIPAYVLGGFYWGIAALGFLPRELTLAIAVWLLFGYFFGVREKREGIVTGVFVLAGLLANWYPVLFFHFAFMLFVAEIIRTRRLAWRNLANVAVFFLAAAFAVFDVLKKSGMVTPPDLDILHFRFGYMLLSPWQYAVFRYLRRFIVYGVMVGASMFAAKRILDGEERRPLQEWYAILISAGIFSIIGILLEYFTPYTRFLFSRISVWFTFAAMVILAYLISEFFKRIPAITWKKTALFAVLMGIFILQSAIPTFYRNIRDLREHREDQLFQKAMFEKIPEVVPQDALVLADPKIANKIRAYGSRGTYVSWKEGGIALLDGAGGREWADQLRRTAAAFETRDFKTLAGFATEHRIRYLLIDDRAFWGSGALEPAALYTSGPYRLVELKK